MYKHLNLNNHITKDWHVWTIVTNNFVNKEIYHLIFNILLIYCDASNLEKIIGSGTYFLLFNLKNCIISTLIFIIMIIT